MKATIYSLGWKLKVQISNKENDISNTKKKQPFLSSQKLLSFHIWFRKFTMSDPKTSRLLYSV